MKIPKGVTKNSSCPSCAWNAILGISTSSEFSDNQNKDQV